jgi:competence protein ComEA
MGLDGRAKAGVGAAAVLAIVGGWGAWSFHQNGGSFGAASAAPLVPVSVAGTPAAPVEIPAGGPDPASPSPAPTPTPPARIKVHVTGAVKKPDVYTLKPGDRIEDAIKAAGGFTADADRDALNLADFARDADQYNVPKQTPPSTGKAPAVSPAPRRPAVVHGSEAAPARKPGDTATTPPVGRILGKPAALAAETTDATETGGKPSHASRSGAAKFKNPGDGTVNLNIATAEELQKLPGVGPSTAQKILEYRQQSGKFDDISQIQDVKGIGPKKFEKMKLFLTAN